MKRMLFIAALAALAPACVEGINPVQLVRAMQVDSTCGKPAQNVGDRLAGFLDYNLSNQYVIALGLFSPLDTNQTTTGTGFIGEEIVYNYESQGVKATFKEESTPVYFAVPAGAEPGTDSFVVLNLIGTEAIKKLDSLVPSSPDSMTLLTTVKIKGKLASGKTTETNELTYPITLTRAGCPDGQVAEKKEEADICNPAQDGSFKCVTPPPAP